MAETVPPLTGNELEQDLLNPEFTAYWYIGNEADRGWKFARTAHSLIPRLRIFLIKDGSQITRWNDNGSCAGIVFGWSDDVHCRLSQAETEDLQTVIDKIKEAMAP